MYQSRIIVSCFTLAIVVTRPAAAQNATDALTHPAPRLAPLRGRRLIR